MAEDVVLGVAEVAGVAVVEDGAGDSDIRCTLSAIFQDTNFSTFNAMIRTLLI